MPKEIQKTRANWRMPKKRQIKKAVNNQSTMQQQLTTTNNNYNKSNDSSNNISSVWQISRANFVDVCGIRIWHWVNVKLTS